MKKKKRLAILTPAEDKAWVDAFSHYKSTGDSDYWADRHAWRDVQAEFPRPKKYDGAKA